MAGNEHFTSLSGDGEIDFSAAFYTMACQVHVSTLADRVRQLTLTQPYLYKGLGWWSLYSHKGNLGSNPTGYVSMPPNWIQFANQYWRNVNDYPWDKTGADGFHYHLYPGTVAEFWFMYP